MGFSMNADVLVANSTQALINELSNEPSNEHRRPYWVKHHHPQNGSLLGFWLYLMSDCLIFACLFACYAVLGKNYAGGPTGAQLFDLKLIAVSTAVLLVSSLTYGMALLATLKKDVSKTIVWLIATGILGLTFLGLEIYEFHHLISVGATPQRSGFLTAFYALVGTHGLHVLFGIIWLVVLLFQIKQHGLPTFMQRRILCLSMFWHFLDVVWIGVFTFVYLMGVLP